jgi:DNA-binding transcriptional LysR family regulator
MSQFTKEFLRRNPKANVRLEYQHPERVYGLVQSNQVDLGLVSYPKSTRTIKATPWRDEPMVLVCSPEHEWASRSAVRLEELDGRDFVGFDEQLTIRREIDRALTDRNAAVNVVMAFDNIETLKAAVEINAGVSLLPEPTVRREVQLGVLASARVEEASLFRPLGVIHRRGAEMGKTAERFRQLLLEQPGAHAAEQVDERPARHADEEKPAADSPARRVAERASS